MPNPAERPPLPPLDQWRSALQPQALADRLHAAVVVALKIAAGAGYRITPPTESKPYFEFEQIPSEDWALPRPVKEAVKLLDLANDLVPLLAADPPHPHAALVEQAFTAGELSARMPAWEGVKLR